jgi:hypothetical protein
MHAVYEIPLALLPAQDVRDITDAAEIAFKLDLESLYSSKKIKCMIRRFPTRKYVVQYLKLPRFFSFMIELVAFQQ